MDGHRFDLLSKSLATRDSRRSTLQALAASVLAIGLGGLGLEDASAQCKPEGKKCKKSGQCCSGKCKGKKGKKKCRCRALKEPCTGTTGDNTCCGDLLCSTSACEPGNRCCRPLGESCSSTCDCCSQGAQCVSGECCLGEGGLCGFVGDAGCCPGLFCDAASGVTCQPV
jgi:hypothetical protein